MFPYITTRMYMNTDRFQTLRKIRNHQRPAPVPTRGPLAATSPIDLIPLRQRCDFSLRLSPIRGALQSLKLGNCPCQPWAVPPSLAPERVQAPRTAPDPFVPHPGPSRRRPRLRDARCGGDKSQLKPPPGSPSRLSLSERSLIK